MVLVGFALPPEQETLGLLEPLILEDPDYYEVAPETLWTLDGAGALVPNGYHRIFEELRARTGRPFVGHGVGYSVGGLSPADEERRATWRARLAETHAAFDFLWYSDHLGATVVDGCALTLPLPLPMVDEVADACRAQLRSLQTVVPRVAVENSAFYYALGDPLAEPAFLQRVLDAPDLHLLLDLHNLYTNALNLGFDPRVWLERFDLGRVVEIHLSGGKPSEPGWLPDGRVLRLDSHDTAVPEEVWRLFEEALPRCTALRGVTLERFEGTIEPDEVPLLREELARARAALS